MPLCLYQNQVEHLKDLLIALFICVSPMNSRTFFCKNVSISSELRNHFRISLIFAAQTIEYTPVSSFVFSVSLTLFQFYYSFSSIRNKTTVFCHKLCSKANLSITTKSIPINHHFLFLHSVKRFGLPLYRLFNNIGS